MQMYFIRRNSYRVASSASIEMLQQLKLKLAVYVIPGLNKMFLSDKQDYRSEILAIHSCCKC